MWTDWGMCVVLRCLIFRDTGISRYVVCILTPSYSVFDIESLII